MHRRIAFTGPSGSGKTTLVRWVEQEYKLPWINGSSGSIKTPQQNKFLESKGLVVGRGHLNVIQSGHLNPLAAIQNQWQILDRRLTLFQEQFEFVTDRCTIDNWVYYLNQCSMYESSTDSANFLNHCIKGINYLTHIFFIPTRIPVEDNGSRVPNQAYQEHFITPVFGQAMNVFQQKASNLNCEAKFFRIYSVSLEDRKEEIRRALWEN